MQALSLQVPAGSGAWYPSLLLDYHEDSALMVGAPSHGGMPLKVDAGVEVGVEVPLFDGLRRFRVKVQSREVSPPSLWLGWPEEAERLQRRENVRVPVQLRTDAATLDADGRPATEPMDGMTTDVSAGGMRIVLPREVPAGSEVGLVLHIPDAGPQECHAVVLRGGRIPRTRGPNRHWIAVAFTAVSPSVQRAITRLVFDVQRDLLRRDAL
jgi:c-di-GMP-binding flagellar brake protein YcgR